MRHLLQRSLVPVIAGLLALGAAACDIDALADGLNIPIEFESAVNLQLDIGDTTGPAAGTTAPVGTSFPMDGPAVDVDLASQNSSLDANKEKLRSIELTGLTVTPRSNSLTHASPPLDLYIGPKGATTSQGGARIATIPSIPAGSTAVVTATLDDAGQAAAQAHLRALDFTVIPAGTIAVTAGETVPGGALDLEIALGIKAVVNPTK